MNISPVSFGALHIVVTPELEKFKRTLAEKPQAFKVVKDAFEQINKGTGDRDVYFKVYEEDGLRNYIELSMDLTDEETKALDHEIKDSSGTKKVDKICSWQMFNEFTIPEKVEQLSTNFMNKFNNVTKKSIEEKGAADSLFDAYM